ncbi:MAG TPA: ribosome assembly cofactor RimP [Bacteroidia bacterium]|jgi:ribosome maturation factor RimP|nr:ribosome assembly cofactor RimP [Bacteroidia bacterium]
MISESNIKALTEQKIGGTALFLVDVKVKPGNRIEIFVDAPSHVSVDDCVSISKHVEANLNRDIEDFELTVSSPGIDQPFKVLDQYRKSLGKEVSVLQKDGVKVIGKLIAANEEEICIETKKTERGEKGKGRQTIIENITIQLNQIKETKLILPF